MLSGTVFQEILIWKVEKNVNSEFSEVLHRLRGHKVCDKYNAINSNRIKQDSLHLSH